MLGIMLLTYNRLNYAKQTLESTLQNLVTAEPIRVHIASDGDTDEYIEQLRDIAEGYAVSVTNSGRNGYGANFNLATQQLHLDCEFILPLEDDWKLIRRFNIDSILDVLRDRVFGCVRLGYIGYTQTLSCNFVSHNGHHWLSLDSESTEPHVFAGHPRLETVAWERSVGPWDEGLLPGQTEWNVAKRDEARRGVAWPISLIKPEGDAWVHIGSQRSY